MEIRLASDGKSVVLHEELTRHHSMPRCTTAYVRNILSAGMRCGWALTWLLSIACAGEKGVRDIEFRNLFPSTTTQGTCLLARANECEVIAVSTRSEDDEEEIRCIFVRGKSQGKARKLARMILKELPVQGAKILNFRKEEPSVVIVYPNIADDMGSTLAILRRPGITKNVTFTGWKGTLVQAVVVPQNFVSKKGEVELMLNMASAALFEAEFRDVKGALNHSDMRRIIAELMYEKSDPRLYKPLHLPPKERNSILREFRKYRLIQYLDESDLDFAIIYRNETYFAGSVRRMKYISQYGSRAYGQFTFPEQEDKLNDEGDKTEDTPPDAQGDAPTASPEAPDQHPIEPAVHATTDRQCIFMDAFSETAPGEVHPLRQQAPGTAPMSADEARQQYTRSLENM